VIGFVCLGSKFAAVRTALPLPRGIGAYMALARTKNVGEAPLPRLTALASRRGITEQRDSRRPRQEPERHPRHAIAAGKQTSQTTNLAELIAPSRMFAGLVLHQIRPHAVKQVGIGSSHTPNVGVASMPERDVGSSCPLRSADSMAATASLPDPFSAPVETLFSELAGRRLGTLTAKEQAG
jgi:hypothetical protein